MPDFEWEEKLWKKGFRVVAGADEVGRGSWAGQVVASTVVFAPYSKFHVLNSKDKVKIDDSKKLSAKQREKAEKWIKKNCLSWGIGAAPVWVVNKLGIGKATQMAFRRALKMLNAKCQTINGLSADYLLIDAFYLPYTKGLRRKNQMAITGGDSKSFSIAAASILAKVYRDRLMSDYAQKHPEYDWEKNKGYGTRAHQQAIKEHGLTRLHRNLFVRKLVKILS